jgi:transcriptional regulator with GAF, ATPase, and Fis domain
LQAQIRTAILRAARSRTTHELCQAFADGLALPSVVLARVWLTTRSGDLQLAGSAGLPTGGGAYNRLDGAFSRIPRGTGKIGQIAATRAPYVVRGIRGDEDWIANPGWIARQGVRALVGYPLIANDDVVGVLAVFDRAMPTDAMLEDLQFVADYAAARIVDVRDHAAHAAGEVQTFAAAPIAPAVVANAGADSTTPAILTRGELRALETRTLAAALARTNGKVFGPHGAAALLGMKPTTLVSRLKALGLR